ncbi:Re/Si-specific NAD(P)(+) transhydrogenase subunit alpha [Oculatella sp. LEGE 06141]|uniref:Re/Si-specific NAD(P)(+) transhydrogenase subunit alpha n=1 Tax=Oculatella sp. LEGE 06141 TaxID=1828648 RepID=UPI001882F2DE|nr:Re/Si-specific NAD(P)(+) transhydrogenase subunit alpha [Oculatella sp. LEGE 06141]MBE9179896.1 Re/Si-specific NAD(P)(+) transhydrogenase subunit alpha [Oculatella sp. LEGE 06141]
MTLDIAKDRVTDQPAARETKTSKTVGIPKEVYPGECRVAVTPDTAKVLQNLGFDVVIEAGAGEAAHFSDDAYRQAGCQVVDGATVWRSADIILKVRPPDLHPTFQQHEVELLPEGSTLISFIYPAQNPDLLKQLADRKATVLAMDTIPRITRAQTMDALSSMANLAGYRAVVEAANHFGRFFTGQITAAGKVPPAKVLVIGAGVAGLAAIATAKGLGAIVRAFDTRPVVKEQVESLGAEFLELHVAEDGTGSGGYAKEMSDAYITAEMELFAAQAKDVDIIITTALIPGKKSPVLITQDMVESMKQGSVIVDLAAEQGGNCAMTKPGDVYRYHDITIVGLTDLPSRMAQQASQLYGTNLCHLLREMGGGHEYAIHLDDDVIQGALVLHNGAIVWPPVKKVGGTAGDRPDVAAKKPAPESDRPQLSPPLAPTKPSAQPIRDFIWLPLAGLALLGIGIGAPASFLSHFTVFVLACFIGWQVIWNVKPALHTPLMSVTNAISGIIIIGGMLQIAGGLDSPTTILGAIAIFIGAINIAGGFWVTQRMLRMFQKDG